MTQPLTLRAVADQLGKDISTIRRWRDRGWLRCRLIGGRWHTTEADLAAIDRTPAAVAGIDRGEHRRAVEALRKRGVKC